MNGRVYDPLTSMFLSPDPYVQAPDNWLNYNRYGYCFGNPFKYTDPNGKVFFLLVPMIYGAIIGAFSNAAIMGFTGQLGGGPGSFFKAMGVGALAGAAGAAAGGYVGSIMKVGGFLGGAASGAAGGAAGGFVGGAGNVWANGGSFGDGLSAGFKGGLIGGVTGGLIGGMVSGVNAVAHDGNFWDGVGAKYDMIAPKNKTDDIKTTNKIEYSNKSAKEFSDSHFGKKIDGLEKLHADGTLPENYSTEEGAVFNKEGDQVWGTTRDLGGRNSNEYCKKSIESTRCKLWTTDVL